MQAEFKAIHDVKMLCDMPTSVYTLQVDIKLLHVCQELFDINLQHRRNNDNYTSLIDLKLANCTSFLVPLVADTDADVDTMKTITKMSEQQYVFYVLCGISRDDMCE